MLFPDGFYSFFAFGMHPAAMDINNTKTTDNKTSIVKLFFIFASTFIFIQPERRKS